MIYTYSMNVTLYLKNNFQFLFILIAKFIIIFHNNMICWRSLNLRNLYLTFSIFISKYGSDLSFISVIRNKHRYYCAAIKSIFISDNRDFRRVAISNYIRNSVFVEKRYLWKSVKKKMRVAIVGAGVIGVTSALAVKNAFPCYDVKIFADAFSPDTTGDGSAGLWSPYLLGDTPIDNITWLFS